MCCVGGIKIILLFQKMLKNCALYSLRLLILILCGAVVVFLPTSEPHYQIKLVCEDGSVKYDVDLGAFDWEWNLSFGTCWGGNGHKSQKVDNYSIHFLGFKISYGISLMVTLVTSVALAKNVNVKIMQGRA